VWIDDEFPRGALVEVRVALGGGKYSDGFAI
jgi:hypothetical protein